MEKKDMEKVMSSQFLSYKSGNAVKDNAATVGAGEIPCMLDGAAGKNARSGKRGD